MFFGCVTDIVHCMDTHTIWTRTCAELFTEANTRSASSSAFNIIASIVCGAVCAVSVGCRVTGGIVDAHSRIRRLGAMRAEAAFESRRRRRHAVRSHRKWIVKIARVSVWCGFFSGGVTANSDSDWDV